MYTYPKIVNVKEINFSFCHGENQCENHQNHTFHHSFLKLVIELKSQKNKKKSRSIRIAKHFFKFYIQKKLPTLCVHIISNHFNKFTTPTSRNFFIAKMLIYSSFFNIHIFSISITKNRRHDLLFLICWIFLNFIMVYLLILLYFFVSNVIFNHIKINDVSLFEMQVSVF